jgi:hypothetical protein
MTLQLEDTELHRALVTQCVAGKARPLTGTKLVAVVDNATRVMADVLNRACTNFEEYTLHDEQHAVRVVDLMYRVMGPHLVEQLNPIEIALLILAAYGHDTGMAVGSADRERLSGAPDYQHYLRHCESDWLQAEQAREAQDLPRYRRLDALLFQGYLRRCHHEISAKLVETQFAPNLVIEEKSLARPTALLCKSHGQPIEEVAKLRAFPFAFAFKPDLQFLACVLRLADYLDLDASRAPRSLMELIGVRSVQSLREWHKHQASNFSVTDTAIDIEARFTDFFEEKAFRDTVAGLEAERHDCVELLQTRHDERGLRLSLVNRIEPRIESVGYRYEEFRFALEYREIMALLMGTRLYRDERVFLRELLQNSLDACRHADAAAGKIGRQTYNGKIVVRRFRTAVGQEVVEVRDNGAGMTPAIIREYFMRVGRSYYHSLEFRSKNLDFKPVSQFGIGILSCFMRADYLEVETCPDPLVHPGAVATVGTQLEIRGPHEFFVVRDLPDALPGTAVRVFLRVPLIESLPSLVAQFIGRLPYTVEIQDGAAPPVEFRNRPFDFPDAEYADRFVDVPGTFEYASRDLTFDGRFGFGLHGRMRFFLLQADGRRHLRLRDTERYSSIEFNALGVTLASVKRLTEDIQQALSNRLDQVRVLQHHFSTDSRADLDAIFRHFERILEHLADRPDGDEVRPLADALKAEIAVLTAAPAFQSQAAAVSVRKQLASAMKDVQSFVSGRFPLSIPAGVLTQDGIPLPSVNLPSFLKLGVGFLYNLDLCGEYRLSLNAARDDIVPDAKLDKLVHFLHQRIGEFLGAWFRVEKIAERDLQRYVTIVPPRLGAAVSSIACGEHKR